jgi:hypothetical protein
VIHDIDGLIEEARTRLLLGWDVSYGGRIVHAEPWDFTAIVAEHARHAASLLDLGTGGGEWLSKLPNRPANTVATEGWPPNVSIARERLASFGIPVHGVEAAPYNVEQSPDTMTGALPLPDKAFTLVTSRHESYLPHELRRVMVDDGLFLTQQVASGASDDFYRLLGRPVPAVAKPWTLAFAVAQLECAGFEIIDADEGDARMDFADIGALAWYLQHMPFVLPDFALEAGRDALARLHEADEPITVRQPLFRLTARKADLQVG